MESISISITNERAIRFIETLQDKVNKSGFCNLTYARDAKLLKRGNPLKDEKVEIVTTYNFLSFGLNYESLMQKAQERSGLDGNYIADKPNGLTFVEGFEKFLLRSDKDPQRYTLRLYNVPNIKDEEGNPIHKNYTKSQFLCYMVNGEIASPEQVEIIEQFLPKKKEAHVLCEKQINNGINEEVITYMPKNFLIDNVLRFKFGYEYIRE